MPKVGCSLVSGTPPGNLWKVVRLAETFVRLPRTASFDWHKNESSRDDVPKQSNKQAHKQTWLHSPSFCSVPTHSKNRIAVPRKCRCVSMATGAAEKLVVKKQKKQVECILVQTSTGSPSVLPQPPPPTYPGTAGWLTAHWCSAA